MKMKISALGKTKEVTLFEREILEIDSPVGRVEEHKLESYERQMCNKIDRLDRAIEKLRIPGTPKEVRERVDSVYDRFPRLKHLEFEQLLETLTKMRAWDTLLQEKLNVTKSNGYMLTKDEEGLYLCLTKLLAKPQEDSWELYVSTHPNFNLSLYPTTGFIGELFKEMIKEFSGVPKLEARIYKLLSGDARVLDEYDVRLAEWFDVSGRKHLLAVSFDKYFKDNTHRLTGRQYFMRDFKWIRYYGPSIFREVLEFVAEECGLESAHSPRNLLSVYKGMQECIEPPRNVLVCCELPEHTVYLNVKSVKMR